MELLDIPTSTITSAAATWRHAQMHNLPLCCEPWHVWYKLLQLHTCIRAN